MKSAFLRITLLSLAMLLLYFTITAQHLSIFEINADNYPLVEGRFYAFDKGLEQIIDLKKGDVTINENGNKQEVIKVTNPTPKKPKQLSVVLTVDISGSMNGDGIKMAKNATSVFVNMLPLDQSECALNSFNEFNYLNVDFCHDKNRLLGQINKLFPEGGTNYDAAFSSSITGAGKLAEKGRNKRVIVFMTDGLSDANENDIIAHANKHDVEIYCITLGMSMPTSLQNIAKKTGGKYFENVWGIDEMQSIYEDILFLSQEYEPSTVTWKSAKTCINSKQVLFQSQKESLKALKTTYLLSKEKGISLLPNKDLVQINFDQLNTAFESTVTLKAINDDFKINSFKCDIPGVKLKDSTLPLTVSSGQSTNLKITYTPSTATYKNGTISFLNDQCEPIKVNIRVSPMGTSIENPIKVQHPNGGETFYAGTETNITWTGTNDNQQVQLSYSMDNGKSWDIFSGTASGGSHTWETPDQTSSQMKIKVLAEEKKVEQQSWKILHGLSLGDNLNSYMKFDSESNKYVLRSKSEYTVKDMTTGKTLSTYPYTGGYPIFNKDGSTITLVKKGEQPIVYNASTGTEIDKLPIIAEDADFSTQNDSYIKKIDDKNYEITNTQTGEIITNFTTDFEGSFISHYDGDYAVISPAHGTDDFSCYVWDIKNNKPIIFKTPEKTIWKGFITADQKYLAVWSWNYYGKNIHITVFDFKTKEELYSIKNTEVSDMANRLILVGNELLLCPKEGSIVLVEIASGNIIKTFPANGTRNYYLAKDDRTLMYIDKSNQTVRVNATGYGKQPVLVSGSDESDNTFSIIAPKLNIPTIDFGEVVAGQKKDTVIQSYFNNADNIDIVINSLKLTRGDALNYSIVSPTFPLTLKPKEKLNIEWRFSPSSKGNNSTPYALFKTSIGDVPISLKGFGIEEKLKIKNQTINLGKVAVGASIDTTIIDLIQNLSDQPLEIADVEFIGPDHIQFNSPSKGKAFSLTPNSFNDFEVNFNTKTRGVSSCKVKFKLKGSRQFTEVIFIAEAVSPREYEVVATTYDQRTKRELSASIQCFDLETNLEIKSHSALSNEMSSSFSLQADRKYKLVGTKEKFTGDEKTLDLSDFRLDKKQEVSLFLESTEKAPSELLVAGFIIDDSTNVKLTGQVTITNKDTKTLIATLNVTDSDKGYEILLPYSATYEVVAESESYLPSQRTIAANDTSITYENSDFLLSKIIIGQAINLKNVLFVQSKAKLKSTSFEQLNMLLKLLQENENLQIELSGHTDNRGNEKLNIALSKDRVETIKNYLIDAGINKKRIDGKGYGSKFPIADNTDENKRYLNRRVEFKVVE